ARWSVGARLPNDYRRRVIVDFYNYYLPPPPPRSAWVWYDDEAYLIALNTGIIAGMALDEASESYANPADDQPYYDQSFDDQYGSGTLSIGYNSAETFASPNGFIADRPRPYTIGAPPPGGWGLSGVWTLGSDHASSDQRNVAVAYNFG